MSSEKSAPKPFGLSKTQVRTFHEPVLEYLPPLFDPEAVQDSEYEDLESLAQLARPSVIEERIARLGVSLSVDQMSERLLFNDGKRAVVSGLRFRNLDLRFPFVALKANFRINEPETARVLRSEVMRVYGDADPRGFTMWEQPGLDLGQTENWGTVVAGSSDVSLIESPARLEFRWDASPSEYFSLLEQEHREWSASVGSLSAFIRLESYQDLEAAGAKGLLMSVWDDRGWAGVIAGKSSPLYGREALYLIEIFLARRLRGQGLGKVLQSQFLFGARESFDLVWGHIHRSNIPSMRTAMSLGRTPLQQEYFFTLSSG